MGNGSLPPWAQNLRSVRHKCGQFAYVGLHDGGDHQFPVFQLAPGVAVLCCPTCGLRWKLDHCRQVGEPTEEEFYEQQDCYQHL